MPRGRLRWTLESGSSRVPRRRRSALAELADQPDLHPDHTRYAGDSLEQSLVEVLFDFAVKVNQATGHLDLDLVPCDRGHFMEDPDDLSADRLVTAEEHFQQLRPTDDPHRLFL